VKSLAKTSAELNKPKINDQSLDRNQARAQDLTELEADARAPSRIAHRAAHRKPGSELVGTEPGVAEAS